MLLEKGADRRAQCRVATDLQFVNKEKKPRRTPVSAKCCKVKLNKMRYACILYTR